MLGTIQSMGGTYTIANKFKRRIFVGAHPDGATGFTPPMSNSFLNGNIAEIIGYAPPTNMSVADIKRVEGYLAWKWGLQANLPANHPHYSAQPT